MNEDKNINNNEINHKLNTFLETNPHFVAKNDCIFCKICQTTLNVHKKSCIKDLARHLFTKKHIEKNNFLLKKQKSVLLGEDNVDKIHLDLVKWMIQANIPLKVLDNPETKNFFKDSFNFSIYRNSNYRKKYLSIIINEECVKIKNHFLRKIFCIYLDEACDANEGCIKYFWKSLIKLQITVNFYRSS